MREGSSTVIMVVVAATLLSMMGTTGLILALVFLFGSIAYWCYNGS